jgi:hypothetical protein
MDFDNENQKKCAYCLLPGVMLRCSKCHDTYYCSKECQAQDWKTHDHRSTCKRLQMLAKTKGTTNDYNEIVKKTESFETNNASHETKLVSLPPNDETTKSDQNSQTTKSDQNLQTTKSDQNLQTTKSDQNLQSNTINEIKAPPNDETTKRDQNSQLNTNNKIEAIQPTRFKLFNALLLGTKANELRYLEKLYVLYIYFIMFCNKLKKSNGNNNSNSNSNTNILTDLLGMQFKFVYVRAPENFKHKEANGDGHFAFIVWDAYNEKIKEEIPLLDLVHNKELNQTVVSGSEMMYGLFLDICSTQSTRLAPYTFVGSDMVNWLKSCMFFHQDQDQDQNQDENVKYEVRVCNFGRQVNPTCRTTGITLNIKTPYKSYPSISKAFQYCGYSGSGDKTKTKDWAIFIMIEPRLTLEEIDAPTVWDPAFTMPKTQNDNDFVFSQRMNQLWQARTKKGPILLHRFILVKVNPSSFILLQCFDSHYTLYDWMNITAQPQLLAMTTPPTSSSCFKGSVMQTPKYRGLFKSNLVQHLIQDLEILHANKNKKPLNKNVVASSYKNITGIAFDKTLFPSLGFNVSMILQSGIEP